MKGEANKSAREKEKEKAQAQANGVKHVIRCLRGRYKLAAPIFVNSQRNESLYFLTLSS